MFFQFVIQSLFAMACLYLAYKIGQLINVIIKEYKETEKLRRAIMKTEVKQSRRLNEKL